MRGFDGFVQKVRMTFRTAVTAGVGLVVSHSHDVIHSFLTVRKYVWFAVFISMLFTFNFEHVCCSSHGRTG